MGIRIGIGGLTVSGSGGVNWAAYWAKEFPWKNELLSDTSDESSYELTNAEFSTDQVNTGTQCIKMNVPAGGASSLKYTFDVPIDMRYNNIAFKLMAVSADIADMTIATFAISTYGPSGPSVVKYTSGPKLTAFRQLGEWVTECITDTWDKNNITFINQFRYVPDMSLTIESSTAIVVYFDTIHLVKQEKTFPTSILFSADDGYVGWVVDAAAIANPLGIKLSAAVTKSFIEAGSHEIGGVLRTVATYEQLLAFQAAGNEVTNHSKTHPNVNALTEAQFIDESLGWANELAAMGFDPISAKAWIPPNGGVNALSQELVKKNMISQRNQRLFNLRGKMGLYGYDIYNLGSSLFESMDLAAVANFFESLPKENVLVILYGHAVYDDSTGTPGEYATPISVVEAICHGIVDNNINSITYKDLYQLTHISDTYEFDQETYQTYLKAYRDAFLADNIKIKTGTWLHYDMSESAESDVIDLSGNGIDGVKTNIGKGTGLNSIVKTATTSVVTLPTANWIGDSNFTIICAFRVNAIPSSYFYLFNESRSGSRYARISMTVEANGMPALRLYSSGGAENLYIPNPVETPVIGDWIICAGRRDITSNPGNSSLNLMVWYQDRRRRYTKSSPLVGIGTTIENTEPDMITLLQENSGVGNEIGDLIIWKEYLTDYEVIAAVRKLNKKYKFSDIL